MIGVTPELFRGDANRTIKGHIVDESGRNVEFASIHADSIYAVSDKDGNFPSHPHIIIICAAFLPLISATGAILTSPSAIPSR